MATGEVPVSSRKLKKRKLESLEELPVPVDLDTPEKKKKKKKKVEKEELSLHPVDGLVQSEREKKKKKKEKAEEQQEEELSLHPVDGLVQSEREKKKKKKKKKKKEKAEEQQEEEVSLHPVDGLVQSEREEEREDECVEEVKIQKKKKKKKKKLDSVTMETDPHHKTTRKKEKKKKHSHFRQEGKKEEKIKSKKKNDDDDLRSEEQINWVRVDELQEFIPDVRKSCPAVIRRLLKYDLHRFQNFKRQGVHLRFGRFSKKENEQISANISDFLALTGISSTEELLFPQRFQDKEAELRKLRVKHHFLEKIAEGVPHPCFQVITRAKKLIDPYNHLGRFSEDEIKALKKLQKLHGNNWSLISKKMGRSLYSVQKRFATLDAGHGVWSEEETARLKLAVRAYLESLVQPGSGPGLTRNMLCNNLPWMDISLKVQTRSWVQCRLKWFSILKHGLSSHRSTPRTSLEVCQTKICLINKLYNMSVEDVTDIDWVEVAQAVGYATPVCVQKMFNRLKCRKVPNWINQSFEEIINFLQSNEVPYLQKKVESYLTWAELQVPQGEETYRIEDIFDEDEFDNS